MSKNKEPKKIKELDFNDLERLNNAVHAFMGSGDDAHCDQDTIEINIYDNGKIEISAIFNHVHSEEITI